MPRFPFPCGPVSLIAAAHDQMQLAVLRPHQHSAIPLHPPRLLDDRHWSGSPIRNGERRERRWADSGVEDSGPPPIGSLSRHVRCPQPGPRRTATRGSMAVLHPRTPLRIPNSRKRRGESRPRRGARLTRSSVLSFSVARPGDRGSPPRGRQLCQSGGGQPGRRGLEENRERTDLGEQFPFYPGENSRPSGRSAAVEFLG